ncbi:MAG: transcriptional regulator [Thermoproteota archaeon]|nr:MAG: transcriptional regulator [Candidatus Korarchaeota archaeon]
MDSKDLMILSILEENARTPYVEIARRIGISESSVRKRIKKLEKAGVIKKYTAVIDPSKLGYNTVAIVGVDVIPEKYLAVVEALAKFPEVKRVFTSTGDHMIMIEVWARDAKHLNELIHMKYGKIDGVVKLCPAILLERIK